MPKSFFLFSIKFMSAFSPRMDDNLRQRNTSKGNLKDLLSPENGNHSNSDSRQSRSSSNSSTSSKKSRSSSNSSNSSSKMKPTLNKKTKKRTQQLFKLFLLAIALSKCWLWCHWLFFELSHSVIFCSVSST